MDVWVIWADVTILDSGTTPANSKKFSHYVDGTENLGVVSWDSNNKAAYKIVAVGKITPAGINAVVKTGWELKRDRMSRDWKDGTKVTVYWNTSWVDDTSHARFLALIPDSDDKIYDIDGPNILAAGTNDYETDNNFRQWVVWDFDGSKVDCSGYANWSWRGRWKKSSTPQVTLKVGQTSHITLPTKSHFHP